MFKTSLVGLSRVNRQLGAWPLHLGAQRHGPCARASLAGDVGEKALGRSRGNFTMEIWGNEIYWGYINQRDIIYLIYSNITSINIVIFLYVYI